MHHKKADPNNTLENLIPQDGVYTAKTFQVIDSERTENLEQKLELVAELKNYAVHELGLEHSLNYLRYTKNNPRTYHILQLIPKGSFGKKEKKMYRKKTDEPILESIKNPTVITSFYHDLIEEKIWYELKNIETNYRFVTNFSDDIGCDLTESFLQEEISRQAELLFHEDWHWTIKAKQGKINQKINESAATIIGYYGMTEYITAKYGKISPEALYTLKKKKGMKKYSKVIVNAYNEIIRIERDKKINNNTKEKAIQEYLQKTGYKLTRGMVLDAYPYRKHSKLMLKALSILGSTKEFIEFMSRCPPSEKDALSYIEQVTGC